MSRKGKLMPEEKLELVERYLKGEISQSQAANEAAMANMSMSVIREKSRNPAVLIHLKCSQVT